MNSSRCETEEAVVGLQCYSGFDLLSMQIQSRCTQADCTQLQNEITLNVEQNRLCRQNASNKKLGLWGVDHRITFEQ